MTEPCPDIANFKRLSGNILSRATGDKIHEWKKLYSDIFTRQVSCFVEIINNSKSDDVTTYMTVWEQIRKFNGWLPSGSLYKKCINVTI